MLARRLRTASLAGLIAAVRMRPLTRAERRLGGANAATRRAVIAHRAVFAHAMREMKRHEG